ncbi:uncharacterized protein LOC123675737 [Harmonia axyridis]|uniref:uncharacterized protein LOC123675737 n=1 Tax=Harmonia axyridis TaxID=115357 RepID=UPI001E2790DB|nr:uncharacterized protein LOC123675737 [Harmonia axyridis]
MDISRNKLNNNFRKILKIRDYHGSEIEQKAMELYKCLYNISKSDEKYIYIYIKITNPNLAMYNPKNENLVVKLPRNFKIILLSSLRHLKYYDKPQYFPMKSLIHLIVEDLLRTFDYLDFRSVYLMKVLDQVVLKKLDLISEKYELLLGKMYEMCYASPITTLKNFAVSLIHKMELKIRNRQTFNALGNIGILTNYEETRIKLEQLQTHSIHSNLQEYMKFIHKYFHFNVYNKAAGILYRAVISRYHLDDFKIHIWPFWCESFNKHGDSREFQQSFFKYWIPFSVEEYKLDLYIFLREENVSQKFLVEILFELRRRRYISIENLSEEPFHKDFISFLEDYGTNERAFEILCTFPSLNETIPISSLETFEEYFLANRISTYNLEKQATQFLSHIFVSAHVNILKNLNNLIHYDVFMKKLRNFIISSFEYEKNLDLSLKLCKILFGMKRSCKDLKLKYEVPKKYQYDYEENKYYMYLQENYILDLFSEKKSFITSKLIDIFNQSDMFDDTPMWLLKNAFHDFEIDDLNITKVQKGVNYISLYNLEKYLDSQKLGLYKATKDRDRTELILSFSMIEHQIVLALLNVKISNNAADEMFDILKILNVLIIANQMGIFEECQLSTITKMLNFMVGTVEENLHENLSTKTRKVLEHIFCKIIAILNLSPTTLKDCSDMILNKLVVILEGSNMRKVVTEVLNLVPSISEKMTRSSHKSQKTLDKFYKELLDAIVSPSNLKHMRKSRMRKHPRLRSLLHAVCKGSGMKQREFVQEATRKMIWKLMQHKLDPTVHTVILECLEIMIVEPNFHNYTYAYLEEVIKLSLNSFTSSNWSIKNAAIQLTNTVITRIFGVQQTENIRLRSFKEFCVLFPRLSDYFYDVLSSSPLDDRAIIVLQYLSASEVLVYEHLNMDIQIKIDKFLILLERLLVSREEYIIKYVPQAFVNLCVETSYSYHMKKIFYFIVTNLQKKPSNVIVNYLILFREFVRKLNETSSLLKATKIEIEPTVIYFVDKMNDFLKDKDLQFLDMHNIRHFVLDQYSRSYSIDENLNVSSKRWKYYNLIQNFPSAYISKNFLQLFENMYNNVELNFLLEIFLDRIISFACENRVQNLIQMIFNRLTSEIFSSKIKNNKGMCRIFTLSILRLCDSFEYIQFGNHFCEYNIEINFYEAILLQIILCESDCQGKAALCEASFKKLSEFSSIDSFELEFLPKMLGFIHKNLDVLNKYMFLKFLFCLVLTDCDKEDICDFMTKFCRKYTNEDNCLSNLLVYEFLYDFFRDDQLLRKFLLDALNLINKFESRVRFDTFYMDTYQSLQVHKDVINKMMSKFYQVIFFRLTLTCSMFFVTIIVFSTSQKL